MSKKCYICEKWFNYNKKEKKIHKLYRRVRDHCHFTGKFRGAAHGICNLRYKVPHEIPVKFHNGSSYDYQHIIKELAEEFKDGYFECLAENSEKYISFSVPIKKECIYDTNEIITCRIKFIDSYRFMHSNLSSLVNNLSEIKGHEKFLDEKTIKDLIKKFPTTYTFCKGDINKFVMLLQKGVYPYEYFYSWKKFGETSLPPKKDFYSELILEDISDSDYEHAKNYLKNIAKIWGIIMICMFRLIHFCLLMFMKILEISV